MANCTKSNVVVGKPQQILKGTGPTHGYILRRRARRRSRQRFLRHLRTHTLTELKASNIEGVGVFALVEIPANTVLFQSTETNELPIRYISGSEFESLPEHVRKFITKFLVPNDRGYPVPSPGLHAVDQSFYLNHSTSANVRLVPTDDHLWVDFVTSRDIIKGEELCLDYRGIYPEFNTESISKPQSE